MDTKSFSAIGATSDITQRLQEVVQNTMGSDLAQIERALQKFRDLQARGFIKKERYVAPSSGELERLYMSR